MNHEISDSGSKTTFSGSLNQDAKTSHCGLNGDTMPDHENVLLSQGPRPLKHDLAEPDHRPAPPPPLENDEILNKPEKASSPKKSVTVNFDHGTGKDSFARNEAAYKLPIRGSVLIPACILWRKPDICKLIRWQSSNGRLTNSSNNVELQALRTPIAPVNKDTMKELEIIAIQNNTSLRNDLCFDDQLFFQPIRGPKGEEKQRRARVFWDCLSLELEAIGHARQGDCAACAEKGKLGKVSDVRIPSRLAVFFTAQRDLIEMLVPDKDKEEIRTKLEVEQLVQLSRVGHFDAADFSTWLAQLLMTHCAPLRDGMARQMNQQVSEGAKTNDMDLLVKGLETLLSLLENMKLDVANHQVRSFKLLLIADTVPFLQDCFSKMRDDQQIDLKNSRKWFKDVQRKHCGQGKSDFDMFIFGAVALCKSSPRSLPTTFAYDKDRIACLQNDVLDVTQLRICTSTFEDLALGQKGRRPTDVELAEVSDRILQLISSEDGTNEVIACHIEEIATEIARAVNAMSRGAQSRVSRRTPSEFDVQRAMNKLKSRLKNEQFSVMEEVIQELTERTTHHASRFQKLDTLQIYNAQRVWSTSQSLKGVIPAPDMEDIARRLAHIIVIHWWVWVNIAYVEDDQPNFIPSHHQNLRPLESVEQGAGASTNQARELACREE